MPEVKPNPESTAHGYESDAMRVRPMLWFLFFFVLGNVLIGVGVHFFESRVMWKGLTKYPPSPPLTQSHVPPNPQLQLTPAHPSSEAQDFQASHNRQEARLHSYGPLPNDPAHVHIPIERAMEMYVKDAKK